MVAAEVGSAYVTLLPSAKGFKKALQRELNTPLTQAGKDAGQALGEGITADVDKTGQQFTRQLATAILPEADRTGTEAGGRFATGFSRSLVQRRVNPAGVIMRF